MTLEEKVGQIIWCTRPKDWSEFEQMAKAGRVGGAYGYIFNGRKDKKDAVNFINRLQKISRYPLLIGGEFFQGSDGVVLDGTGFPTLMALGATRSAELAYIRGKIIAEEARALGFHSVASPLLDVNVNPDNPIINTRAIGDRVELVTELGLEICRGVIENRGLSMGHHFPGHGATFCDSHLKVPVVEKDAKELKLVDIKPYQAGIEKGLLSCILTAHVYYPAFEPEEGLPATLSRNIITGLLRDEMHYDGLIVTDGLEMKAIKDNYGIEETMVRSVLAGNDLLLCGIENDGDLALIFESILKAVRSGKIPLSLIDNSVRRIAGAKEWLGLYEDRCVRPETAGNSVGTEYHREIAKRTARESVTVLKGRGLPLTPPPGKKLLIIRPDEVNIANGGYIPLATPTDRAILDKEIKRRHSPAQSCIVNKHPSENQIKKALSLAEKSDIVVFGIFTEVRPTVEDGIDINRPYLRLIEKVCGIHCKTILIVMGNPYIINKLPEGDICMCTYSDCPYSIEAAVEALFGEIKAKGRLPVTVSGKYPYGYGL